VRGRGASRRSASRAGRSGRLLPLRQPTSRASAGSARGRDSNPRGSQLLRSGTCGASPWMLGFQPFQKDRAQRCRSVPRRHGRRHSLPGAPQSSVVLEPSDIGMPAHLRSTELLAGSGESLAPLPRDKEFLSSRTAWYGGYFSSPPSGATLCLPARPRTDRGRPTLKRRGPRSGRGERAVGARPGMSGRGSRGPVAPARARCRTRTPRSTPPTS
jgi:hypothetical protein